MPEDPQLTELAVEKFGSRNVRALTLPYSQIDHIGIEVDNPPCPYLMRRRYFVLGTV
jgi:hypothetical protein